MHMHILKSQNIIFREIGGTWRRVDSQEPKPPTLAEFIQSLNIIIDDDTQFCRIKRKNVTIEYRMYGGQCRISIIPHKE